MSSDACANLGSSEKYLSRDEPLDTARPETAKHGGLAVSGGVVTSVFGGIGRPTSAESDARRRVFEKLIDLGVRYDDAAESASITPKRALAILWELRDQPAQSASIAA